MERGVAVSRDARREDLARTPSSVDGDNPAERVGTLELGVDFDGLRVGAPGQDCEEREFWKAFYGTMVAEPRETWQGD